MATVAPAPCAAGRRVLPLLRQRTPGQEMVLLVQNPPGGQTHQHVPNWQGHALPGGFGVLETVSGNPCKIQEYPFAWMHTQPGNNTSCNLEDFVGTVVSVPIFDCTLDVLPNRAPILGVGGDPCDTGNGSNAYYHRVGYAAFYLSGYGITTTGSIDNRVPSINPNNTLPPNANPCENSASCVSGWFTTASLSATSISGPPVWRRLLRHFRSGSGWLTVRCTTDILTRTNMTKD